MPIATEILSFQTAISTGLRPSKLVSPFTPFRACARETSTEVVRSRKINDEICVPIVLALHQESKRVRANFFCPGHKQGNSLHPSFRNLTQASVLKADLPELPALDNLFAPDGVIRDAQMKAADTFTKDGSRIWQTYFLVNGTTCGIEAAILACSRPGRKVILPRNAHQSAVHALVLSGAIPVWVAPRYDSRYDLVHTIEAEDVAAALEQNRYEVAAVLLVSPTYHGVCADIEAVAKITHEFGAKLIVDEAHGAHLAFHSRLPKSGTDVHADIVVQSTHKTLTAMSQAAMMHVRRSTVDAHRIRAALQLVQSTSPNYLLLASLDAARALMEEKGEELMLQTIGLAQKCAARIASIEGFDVLGMNDTRERKPNSIVYDLDPTRVTVLLPTGIQGYDLDEYLIAQFGVYAELPSFRHLTFVFSSGTTQSDVDALVTALSTYDATVHPNGASAPKPEMSWKRYDASSETTGITPRQAFFAECITLSANDAIGRISVETLCPYPPGIPLIIAGERVTRESVRILKAVLKAGGSISGASDETLSTIRVVAE